MVQTIVLLGLCAGAVATTAGHRVVFQVFLWPVTLATALSWGLFHEPGAEHRWLDWVLSALIVFFGLILTGLARDTYRVFAESVLIRLQQNKSNQQLRQALSQAESAMAAKTRFLASGQPRPAPADAHAVPVRRRRWTSARSTTRAASSSRR